MVPSFCQVCECTVAASSKFVRMPGPRCRWIRLDLLLTKLSRSPRECERWSSSIFFGYRNFLVKTWTKLWFQIVKQWHISQRISIGHRILKPLQITCLPALGTFQVPICSPKNLIFGAFHSLVETFSLQSQCMEPFVFFLVMLVMDKIHQNPANNLECIEPCN